jgi:hypothetical protein
MFVLFCTLVMITVIGITNLYPSKTIPVSTIDERMHVYFVPAGYAYWVLLPIILGLISFSIYQALPSHRDDPTLKKMADWYIAGSLAQTIWIISSYFQRGWLTLLAAIILLISIILVYRFIAAGFSKPDRVQLLVVKLPFSLYLAWITVSTITIISEALYLNHWRGFGFDPRIWTVTMMVVTVVIAELVAFNHRDHVFLAVLIWEFIGIGVKHTALSPIYEAAFASAIIVSIMLVLVLLIKPKEEH